ncbi:MAG: hypothetical protein ACLUD2_02385 [Clostridium sp.]
MPSLRWCSRIFLPGVLSGFLLAFTMSLDDFIITHFTRGAGINTSSTLTAVKCAAASSRPCTHCLP